MLLNIVTSTVELRVKQVGGSDDGSTTSEQVSVQQKVEGKKQANKSLRVNVSGRRRRLLLRCLSLSFSCEDTEASILVVDTASTSSSTGIRSSCSVSTGIHYGMI